MSPTDLSYAKFSSSSSSGVREYVFYVFYFKKNQKFVTLKYGLSKLILTLTGQKLIEWSLKLFMFFTLI